MTTYCSDKDVNKLIKGLVKQGWVFTKGKKHGKLTSDMAAEPIIISSSPSDKRYFAIVKQLIKRNLLKDCRVHTQLK
jgi:hypothetical protein